MFTGLIQEIGKIVSLQKTGAGAVLEVRAAMATDDLQRGESIAVDGACLTLTEVRGGNLLFDVLKETLERTTFKTAGAGAPVNLERALRVGDRLGGHFLTGHVDSQGTVLENRESGGEWRLTVGVPAGEMKYLVEKGSVGIAGVSLTIANLGKDRFSVCLIPETLEQTHLRRLTQDSRVNLEYDLLGKYVLRYLESAKGASSLTVDGLINKGF